MRLLLIEDNDELAGLVGSHLEASGYGLDRVDCVEDAIAVLDSRSYAAMILDLADGVRPNSDAACIISRCSVLQIATHGFGLCIPFSVS